MASISLNNIVKRYGAFQVIHGVDIDVRDGEFVVLVGPSGCGKSTILRMIAGLEAISGGTLSIGGRKVNGLSSKERDIAMVFQNYALYPHMTVAENMGFSLKLRGSAKTEIDSRVRRAADILALSEYLDRYPRHLSGGQRQRVAMGRAIVRDPAVFLFDEPLSNLDAKLRISMRAEIKDLHQRLGITMIYVTHDQVEAMTMADRIVVLRDGVVEQVGRPLELYDWPDNIFVAGFIGSPAMNLMPGKVEAVNGTLCFRTRNGTVFPAEKYADHDDIGLDTVLGVRPENFEIVAEGTPGSLKGKIQLVEPMGSETHVNLRVGQDDMIAAFRQRVGDHPGAPLSFRFEQESVHLFRQDTGRRIVRQPQLVPT